MRKSIALFLKSLLVFLLVVICSKLNAQTAEIKSAGKVYYVNVGDTLQLGMGANLDGSFMYVFQGSEASLGKEHALRRVTVRKIKYYKRMEVCRVFLHARAMGSVYIDLVNNHLSPALEKKELVFEGWLSPNNDDE